MAKKTVKKGKRKGKRKAGQPTKYKPEYEHQALVLAEKGFTDKEIAAVFSVTGVTINNWKKQFPQFFNSLKKGKKVADQKVIQSLYQRALGYSHPEIHISNHQGEVTKTNIIKHYAPDTTACIFWLKNRDSENWRDRHEQVVTGIPDSITIKYVSSNGEKKGKPK